MPQLAEVVKITKRAESRKDRLVPWSEFEPLLAQLRQALDASNDDAFRYIGYGGGTMVAVWRRDGVPLIAKNAILWVLHDLKQPIALKPTVPRSVFTVDELAELLAAVTGRAVPDEIRHALIRKIAAELAR